MTIQLRPSALAGIAIILSCAGMALGEQPWQSMPDKQSKPPATKLAAAWGQQASNLGGMSYASDLRDQDYNYPEADPTWPMRVPGVNPPAPLVSQPVSGPNKLNDYDDSWINVSNAKVQSGNGGIDSMAPPMPMSDDGSMGSMGGQKPSSNGSSCGCEKAGGDCACGGEQACGCEGGCDSGCGCEGGCECGCDECGDCCCEKHHCLPLIKCEECCPLECCEDEVCRLFDCCCLECYDTAIFGWIDGGIMGNADSPASRFNGPVTFPDQDDGQLNQIYGVVERAVPEDNCGFFVGGRMDILWGSDFWFTTSAGLDGTAEGNTPRWESSNSDLYGWAMPQLYIETAFDDYTIKWGHFYTIIGYEVVPAIGNFFYSHAYTMQYGEPFTHTGALAKHPLGENWTAYYGITNGWDTFSANSRANFLGGVTYSQDDWGSLAFAITTGDNSVSGLPGTLPFDNRTMYSIVWSRNFTSRLTYVLQSDYGAQLNANDEGSTAEWYGLNQYLFYKINCCWTAGMRFEWFRDDDGYRVAGLRPGNPIGGGFAGNFYEVTLGANWKPTANFSLRPEVRWDWYEGPNSFTTGNLPYDDGASRDQFLFGLDAIFQF